MALGPASLEQPGVEQDPGTGRLQQVHRAGDAPGRTPEGESCTGQWLRTPRGERSEVRGKRARSATISVLVVSGFLILALTSPLFPLTSYLSPLTSHLLPLTSHLSPLTF